MKSDTMQVLALAGILLAAIIIGVISWGMIPDSQTTSAGNATTANDTQNGTGSVQEISNVTTVATEQPTPSVDDSASGEVIPAAGDSPSSAVKWTSSKDESELEPNGTAEWNQVISSMVSAKIGYSRLSWDNVFYDNMYGSGNMLLEISWAFTDGSFGYHKDNPDGIGYHGTWATTATTFVVSSGTWNPRWTLGVVHAYTKDLDHEQGSQTNINGQYYNTYE